MNIWLDFKTAILSNPFNTIILFIKTFKSELIFTYVKLFT